MKWRPAYGWRFRVEQFKYYARPLVRRFFRFSITVVCSALLAVYLQPRLPRWKNKAIAFANHQLNKRATVGPVQAALQMPIPKPQAIEAPPQDSWSREINDFYSKYLEEVMRALRSDRNIRIVKLEVSHLILSYQRNLATLEKGGQSLKLHARTTVIPVVAVSRNSKNYLEEMRVTYVDPQALPVRMVKQASFGMSPALLQNFLLVPDLSGKNAKKYVFGKR